MHTLPAVVSAEQTDPTLRRTGGCQPRRVRGSRRSPSRSPAPPARSATERTPPSPSTGTRAPWSAPPGMQTTGSVMRPRHPNARPRTHRPQTSASDGCGRRTQRDKFWEIWPTCRVWDAFLRQGRMKYFKKRRQDFSVHPLVGDPCSADGRGSFVSKCHQGQSSSAHRFLHLLLRHDRAASEPPYAVRAWTLMVPPPWI